MERHKTWKDIKHGKTQNTEIHGKNREMEKKTMKVSILPFYTSRHLIGLLVN
jgi:hypothetical protein